MNQIQVLTSSLFLVMCIICCRRAPIDVFFLPNKFDFFPKVIVDYKTLTLLLVKKDEEDFILGGRGVCGILFYLQCNQGMCVSNVVLAFKCLLLVIYL